MWLNYILVALKCAGYRMLFPYLLTCTVGTRWWYVDNFTLLFPIIWRWWGYLCSLWTKLILKCLHYETSIKRVSWLILQVEEAHIQAPGSTKVQLASLALYLSRFPIQLAKTISLIYYFCIDGYSALHEQNPQKAFGNKVFQVYYAGSSGGLVS